MDKIEELLTRGVETIYPNREELEKLLRSGKKITLYQGFDPTGAQLHIGHMVGFRKLRQWQDLGHHVIFLIGDGTGQAGDPSGKTKARDTFFTTEELRKNATDYVKQASKIVRFEGENPVEIKFNGDWLNKLKLIDILNIAGNFTLQQLSERDLFQERMKKGEPVNLREFLYPLLQGYDSAAMEVDLEIGGSDQLFNMMVGRTLLKNMKNKDKFVMTTPLLADSSGRKIGKTEGNAIALTDKPEDLYGKLMTLPDDVVAKAFEYLTDIPMDEVKSIGEAVSKGEEPMKHKKCLAFEITKQLNDEEAAKNGQEHFEMIRTEEKGDIEVDSKEMTVEEILTKIVGSKSEAKRLVKQDAKIDIDGTKITELDHVLKIEDNSRVQIGRKVYKLKIKSK